MNISSQPSPPVIEKLLRATDIAAVMDISLSAAYRLLRDGEIPAIRIGRGIVRARKCDVDEYVARQLPGGAA